MADQTARTSPDTKLNSTLMTILKVVILLTGILRAVMNSWEINFATLMSWNMPFVLLGHILWEVLILTVLARLIFKDKVKTAFWRTVIWTFGIGWGIDSYSTFTTVQPFVKPIVARFINGVAFAGAGVALFVAGFSIYYLYNKTFKKSL
jgi:hypothetical protein